LRSACFYQEKGVSEKMGPGQLASWSNMEEEDRLAIGDDVEYDVLRIVEDLDRYEAELKEDHVRVTRDMYHDSKLAGCAWSEALNV
jgi:hypothetical protein